MDASKRLSAEQALHHPWIEGTLHEPAQLNRTRDNMRKHLRSRWKVGRLCLICCGPGSAHCTCSSSI